MKKNILKSVVLVGTILCLISCGSNKSMSVVPSVSNPVAANDPTQPVMPAGEQILLTPCGDVREVPNVNMVGLGIAEGCPDRATAILDANRVAIADISTRFVGAIANTIENYNNDSNLPSGQKIHIGSISGGIKTIAKKVVDKYANVECRQLAQSATGSYVGYVAVVIMLADAKKGLIEELALQKIDHNEKKILEELDKSLSK